MQWIRVIAWGLIWSLLAGFGLAQTKPPRRLEPVIHEIEVGRYPEALFYLERLPKKVKASPLAKRLQLQAWLETGQLEKVLDRAPAILSVTPEDHEVRLWLVRAAVDSGAAASDRPTRAQARFELATQEASVIPSGNANYPMALQWRASALISLGRSKDAERLAKDALKQMPQSVAVHIAAARIQEWLAGTGAAVASLYKSEASLMKAGISGPDNDVAALLLARSQVHQRARQIREAQRAIEEAFKIGFQSSGLAQRAGEQIWWLAEKFRSEEDSNLLIDTWLKHHPREAVAQFWKGYLSELRGQPEQAMPYFEKAWTLSKKTHAESALRMALILGARGQMKRGLAMMEHALRLNAPVRTGTMHPAEALIFLADQAIKRKDPKGAIQALEVGAKWLPLRWKLQQNLGFIRREYGSLLAAQKKRSAARRQWKKSAANYELASHSVRQSDLEPRVIAQVLNDTGLMYHYHLDRLKDGERLYLEALTHDAGYIDALENLGVLMLKRRQWARAINWFDKALAVDPKRGLSTKLRAEAKARLSGRK